MRYWLTSNRHAGAYNGNVWDTESILRDHKMYFWKDYPNRRYVKKGDVAFFRIFGDSIIGKFEVGKWKKDKSIDDKVRYIEMENYEEFNPQIPQELILPEMSNKDHRKRLVSITAEDVGKIETIQRTYDRLGFSKHYKADSLFVLESGIEEAVKKNLDKYGLRLASKKIAQQCVMEIGIGRSDLICLDKKDNYVILELKREYAGDETIGQILRYIGYVEKNFAKKGQKVEGWIVAPSYSPDLIMAAEASRRIKIKQLRF